MFLGNPQFGCEVQPIDFAKAAEAMGGRGFTITRPEEASEVFGHGNSHTRSSCYRSTGRCLCAHDAAQDAVGLCGELREGVARNAQPRKD